MRDVLPAWLVSPIWPDLVAHLPPAGDGRDVRGLIHRLTLQAIDGEAGLRVLGAEAERISAALATTLLAAGTGDAGLERVRTDAAALADERALALYEVLLLGFRAHVTEPGFQDRTLTEIRRRMAILEHRMTEAGKRAREFEAVYREATVREEARLYGTTAYVDLSVRPAGGNGGRLEDLLAVHPRLLLEGPAGAGKTTLLRHLALRVCAKDLPPSLDEWRTRRVVPFLVRLRHYVARDGLRLPSPEEFVGGEAAAGKPATWVAELIRQRRAIVLIDGIDEVPASCRPELMSWLDGLTRLHPGARFVLTARPGALDGAQRERLVHDGFAACRLEPMATKQVDEFIRRRCVEGGGERLIETLATRRDLAGLATSPLRCAMLCTLDGEPPLGRDALYEAALARLAPDRVRPALSRVAMWMTLNGRRTIDRDTIDGLGAGAVHESGLLREPVAGLVEFEHAVLQDHLAAAEVFTGDNLDYLVRNAQDPLCHDVIIMAVGQNRNDAGRQERLLGGLIEQAQSAGHDETRILWLLAAACVADLEMVSPRHAELIRDRTRTLLPPKTSEEAYGLANAGAFVFDLVADVAAGRHLTSEEAAATIEVAVLTGRDDAIPFLRHFARYPGKRVRKALVDAWFDSRVPERYVNEVLTDCELSDIVIILPGTGYLPFLHRLTGLQHLDLTNLEIADLEPISTLSSLKHLYLASTKDVKNVALIRAEIPGLQIMS